VPRRCRESNPRTMHGRKLLLEIGRKSSPFLSGKKKTLLCLEGRVEKKKRKERSSPPLRGAKRPGRPEVREKRRTKEPELNLTQGGNSRKRYSKRSKEREDVDGDSSFKEGWNGFTAIRRGRVGKEKKGGGRSTPVLPSAIKRLAQYTRGRGGKTV